jgi:ribosomal protein S17
MVVVKEDFMKHEKKVWPAYFQKILDGKKNYEVRLVDWECNEGDILVLREWSPATKQFTGREVEKEVTYVAKTKDMNFWPEEDVKKYGYQIIAFK